MSSPKQLDDVTAEQLLAELRRRQTNTSEPAAAVAEEPVNGLADLDTATLTDALKSKQKVIYGTDDRQDLFQVIDQAALRDADSVVALFAEADVRNNGDGTSTLLTSNFGATLNLCAGERFRDQPVGAFCSGFLVGPDLVATAGHCIDTGNVTQVLFVFGYRMTDANTPPQLIDNDEIYRGAEIIGHQLTEDGADWALVRLDRTVANHAVCTIRRTGKIADGQAVHVIGHPSGLPAKYAPGAQVRDNAPLDFFVANLDTYGGNSGSPVFNADTHVVEGILVRGETDFVSNGSCNVSLVCPSTGCRGEDSTRTTEFATQVPETAVQ